jgi:succinate dehydrogenase / fumarate reductase cytochrome b subunit
MSSASEAEKSAGSRIDTGFLRARAGSFLAVMPLSVWTIIHLWNNLASFQGAEAWQTSVTSYVHPLAHFATLVVVLLPLVLHMIWGLGRIWTARPNNVRYGFFSNLKYALQRLSALGVLAFLGAHVWLAMLQPRFVQGHPEAFASIAHEMHHHMPTLVVYLLGTLGVTYHLANGLATFAMGWGIVSSRRALHKLDVVAMVLFVVLLAMAWATIYALYHAGA